jgi:hypothetical protein
MKSLPFRRNAVVPKALSRTNASRFPRRAEVDIFSGQVTGAIPMQTYYFNLKDGWKVIPDPEGTACVGDDAAREHAVLVAREAMRNNEPETRKWRIQVCDAGRAPLFEVLFASVDESMDHLPPNIRSSVEKLSRQLASLGDAVSDVRMSMLQLRTTLARADGHPYLVALNGLRLYKEN